jgi:hypothetical protein
MHGAFDTQWIPLVRHLVFRLAYPLVSYPKAFLRSKSDLSRDEQHIAK